MYDAIRGPRHYNWKGDEVSYGAVHYRLRSFRGRAADYDCVQCSGPASQWALDHTDSEPMWSPDGLAYSTDLSRYLPMCVSCHRLFDTAHSGRSRCGSDAGYYRHRRTGGTPCQLCKDAHAFATRARNLRRQEEIA